MKIGELRRFTRYKAGSTRNTYSLQHLHYFGDYLALIIRRFSFIVVLSLYSINLNSKFNGESVIFSCRHVPSAKTTFSLEYFLME